MGAKKPRIVIIGAGMAGLAAANKLYKVSVSRDLLELSVVEGGSRIGGRICTSELGGDRVEVGATWIHGIGGSPIYKIAKEIDALESEQPWERMDGFSEGALTVAEGGLEPDPSIVKSVSILYKKLMDFAQGKVVEEGNESTIAANAARICRSNGCKELSIGSFLRRGLNLYWASSDQSREIDGRNNRNWGSRKSLEEGIFAMHENTERAYTATDNLFNLDFVAESEYREFPDEEITIAKGYSSIINCLASVLPSGLIQLGKKVDKIEWTNRKEPQGKSSSPVRLCFQDGSSMVADHVIVTVSLGVLKEATGEDGSAMFQPPLPSFKTGAISRLGFGVVNKLFLQLEQTQEKAEADFPFLQMVFDQSRSATKEGGKVPRWMRRTASLCPIYKKSRVILGWLAGREALELETLTDGQIVNGVCSALSSFGFDFESSKTRSVRKPENKSPSESDSDESPPSRWRHCNGKSRDTENHRGCTKNLTTKGGVFVEVLKSKWGSDPLFRGSYSYVAVGSSGEDLDLMAEPLPEAVSTGTPPLQLLFAGEATHRTHYSTTHGAYFSGIREADRLMQHYGWAEPMDSIP